MSILMYHTTKYSYNYDLIGIGKEIGENVQCIRLNDQICKIKTNWNYGLIINEVVMLLVLFVHNVSFGPIS
ncbi:hypothetical protein [Bacillus marasmi]|uniref:hypothetical protein n=1 Tax=Bacillus marasmi TaxID=1926279 RepID=UPI0011CC1CC2|nr:hypothetical protein [Bacillus marasmi]